MIVYKLPQLEVVDRLPEGAAVCLGNFDGVHRGHQKLFDAAKDMAKEGFCSCSAVWCFSTLAKPVSPAPVLTDMQAKLDLFCKYGLEYAVFEDFDAVCNTPCDVFVSQYLVNTLRVGGVVCGFNFRFGKGGLGDSALLESLLSALSVPCNVLNAVIRRGLVISSTEIRKRVEEGDMDGAFDLMGHPFAISFPVIHGNRIGRTIGVPTINQSFPKGHIIPKRGIYACTCYVDGEIFLGVANVGVRPTVSLSGDVNCETHIINYSGDLYDKNIKVEFYNRLRDEMKFSSIDELKAQIEKDISSCLQYFAAVYGG